MTPILHGLLSYLLEKIADSGINQFTSRYLDRYNQKHLEELSEEIRKYLAQHLQEADYMTADACLAKQGLYPADSLDHTTLSEELIQDTIDDFCHRNPNKAITIKQLEPILRQALEQCFKALLDCLSPGERLLVRQNLVQAKSTQRGLTEIRCLLQQNLSCRRALLPDQVEHFCQKVNEAIDAGTLSMAKSCLELMETQVDPREHYRWTASRIRLDAFLHDSGNAYHFCDRFLNEGPDQKTTEDLVTFLISIEDFSSLNTIRPVISSAAQTELLDLILKQDMGIFLTAFFDQEMCVRPEYAKNKWVLWAFGNLSLSCGDGYAALSCYQAIETGTSGSLWLKWKKCCARFRDAHSPMLFHFLSSDSSKLSSILQEMFNYSGFFDQTGDALLSQYLQLLFTCALTVSGGQAKLPWDKLSDRAKRLPIAQKYRYQEQLPTWKSIDVQGLRSFCKREGYDDLWANYLIQRAQMDGKYVIEELEGDPDLFQKEFLSVVAYAYAINSTKGIEAALKTIEELTLPPGDKLSKAILLAQISAQFQSPQASPLLDRAFETAVPHPGDHVYPEDIWSLARMLLKAGREQDTLVLSERYQSISPAIGKLRLDLMLRQNGMEPACHKLLDELLKRGRDEDPFLLYCQGVLREKESPGTGCNLFQKSFDLFPDLVNATALLAARINRHDAQKDQVLEFCEHQEDPYAQYLCGRAYLQMGNREQGLRCIFRGLLLCGSSVRDDLCLSYIESQLHSKGHDAPPEMVDADVAVILKNQANDELRYLWLHRDATLIPVNGSDFAGYEHISISDPAAVVLFHGRKGDTVSLDDNQTYSIATINHGDVIAFQYCITYLAQNGQIISGTISDADPEGSIATLLAHLESGEDPRQRMEDLYVKRDPGITLHMFQSCIGRPYYESLQAILLERSIPFWAGNDHSTLRGDCVLTASTLAVLGALGLQPPKAANPEFTVWITPLTFREVIDEIRQFQQSPPPAGVIGKDPNDQIYFIENTAEHQKMRKDFYACIRSWCDYAQKTAEVAPESYPEEFRKLQKAFHSSEIEAVALARSAPYVILSDDLLFRQYLHASNVPNASAIELLAETAPDPQTLLHAMSVLLRCDYRDPITAKLLQKLSEFFSAASDEYALANIAEQTIPLVKQYINTPYTQFLLRSAVRDLIQSKVQFNETLLWIITQAWHLFFMTHPELQEAQPGAASP